MSTEMEIGIDGNLVPENIRRCFTTTSNKLKKIYWNNEGEKCTDCNHRIKNIYNIIDKDGNEHKLGSECLAHYDIRADIVKRYWNGVKKHLKYHKEVEKRKRENLDKFSNEIEYISQYIEIVPNNFLFSILSQIKRGRRISDKQIEAVHKIMNKTSIEKIEEQVEENKKKRPYIIQLFSKLASVSFGFHQAGEVVTSMKDQYRVNGTLTDKQISLLEKYVHRFRRQIHGEDRLLDRDMNFKKGEILVMCPPHCVCSSRGQKVKFKRKIDLIDVIVDKKEVEAVYPLWMLQRPEDCEGCSNRIQQIIKGQCPMGCNAFAKKHKDNEKKEEK